MAYKKTNKAVTVVAALFLVILYAFIYFFSNQTGTESGGLSSMISFKVASAIGKITGGDTAKVNFYATILETPIRKAAHFSEYMVMGILLSIIWRDYLAKNKKMLIIIFIWIFVSAALDEFHQTFISERCGCFRDVCIDFCGGVFGALCFYLFFKLKITSKILKFAKK